MSKLFVILLCVYWAQAEKAASLIAPDTPIARETRSTSDFVGMIPTSITMEATTCTCPDDEGNSCTLHISDATYSLQYPCLSSYCASSDGGQYITTATVWYTAQTGTVPVQYWSPNFSCGGPMIRKGDATPVSIILGQNINDPSTFTQNGCDTSQSYDVNNLNDNDQLVMVDNQGQQVTGQTKKDNMVQVQKCFVNCRANQMAGIITSQMDPSTYNNVMTGTYKPS